MLLQGIEYYFLSQKKSVLKIWSFANLKNDLQIGLPLPNKIISFLFSERIFSFVSLTQILIAFLCLIYPTSYFFSALLLTHLYHCIRFRGNFNGGSDMMTFVVLTGAWFSTIAPYEKFQKFAMIYIGIHLLYSYFKAGIVKIVHSDWRSGKALEIFLGRSVYSSTRKLSIWLKKYSALSVLICWSVLFFELTFIGLLFYKNFAIYYFIIAMIFHFGIFLAFGLNRFFWIWLSAWPAALYALSIF